MATARSTPSQSALDTVYSKMLEELKVKYDEDLVKLDMEYKQLLLTEDDESPLVVTTEVLHASESLVEERRFHAEQMNKLENSIAVEVALRKETESLCEDQVMKMQNMWKEIWHLRKSLDRHLR
jgi:hypothetical protein